MRSRTSVAVILPFCIAGVVLLAGCNGDAGYEIDSEPMADAAGEMADAAGEMADAAGEMAGDAGEMAGEMMPEMTEEAMMAQLERADAADGEVDHVIKQCPGCNLAMEGSADHTVNVHGYEMHFCSMECQERFNEDLHGSIARLETPESE